MVRIHPRSPSNLDWGCTRGSVLHCAWSCVCRVRFICRALNVPSGLRLERVVTILAQLIHPFDNSHGTSDFLGLAGVRSFIRIVT